MMTRIPIEKSAIRKQSKQKKVMRGTNLHKIRSMLGLTTHKFAAICGIGESTVRQWEHGRGNGLSSKGAHKIYASLRNTDIVFTIEWLLENIGKPVSFKDQAISGLYQIAEPNSSFTPDNEPSQIQEEIEFFRNNNPNSITLCIIDDGMEPLFVPGDFVGGKYLSGAKIASLDGKICIVQMASGCVIARKIKKTNEKNTYSLFTINPTTTVTEPVISDIELVSAAPILRVWRVEED